MDEHPLTFTRRQFALSSLSGMASLAAMAAPNQDGMPWSGPAIVRKVYLVTQKPSWPRPDVDLKQDIAEIEANLAELERQHPGDLRFVGGETLREGSTDISSWVEQARAADAILAFNMSSGLGRILQTVLDADRPTLLFSRLFAGHSWANFATFAQAGRKADVIASSDYGELDLYATLFRTIHFMRNSKVLLISPLSRAPRSDDFARRFGTQFGTPSYLDLKAAYDAIDVPKAQAAAEEFTRSAVRVVEPAHAEIVASMRLHFAIQHLLEQEKANAIAIDCLGGFARGELPAYPCVSFSKLNDVGMFGVCECDLLSTMTMLTVTALSNRPGFISDPVPDTSRNEIIHAHCVSATRMQGIGGAASPFLIRSHLEDHKGVSMQVLLPVGETVTVAKFADANKFLVSTGEVTGNVDNPRGCRTKIRTRVKDARKLLEGYSAGLHRVIFYGDHVLPIERLGRLNGFQVVQEG